MLGNFYRQQLAKQSTARQHLVMRSSQLFFSTLGGGNKSTSSPEQSNWIQPEQFDQKFYEKELKAVSKYSLYSEKPVPFVNKAFKANPLSFPDQARFSVARSMVKDPKSGKKRTPQSTALFK